MRAFAESEIVVPDGPYQGRRFACHRQPWTAEWFDAIDSHQWQRHALVKPTQAGGTLCGYVIPVLYHLFEIGETVGLGLPSMDMAADKWRHDLKPAIERSRFRDLIPKSGQGSRGGKFESLTFVNGATLKFFSGGGSDKKRAGFTTRVIAITEVDGLDETGGESEEADKVTQMLARTRAFDDRACVYMECTTTTENGRIWREYAGGTASRLMLRCPHCDLWVLPDREDVAFAGEPETPLDAGDAAGLACPECGTLWNEEARTEANASLRLVHDGQEVTPDGEVVGTPRRTNTLGFRVSEAHNLFRGVATAGREEWERQRAIAEEGEESERVELLDKESLQFTWARPWVPPSWAVDPLSEAELRKRTSIRRGECPHDAEHVIVGVDVGKHLMHWAGEAWRAPAQGVVVDYGRQEVAGDSLGVETGILIALRELHEFLDAGWPITTGGRRAFDLALVDCRYGKAAVFAFVKERIAAGDRRWVPVMGFGATTYGAPHYAAPSSTGKVVQSVGDRYHVKRFRSEGVSVLEIDVDHWKGVVHDGLGANTNARGAITLCEDDREQRLSFLKHVTAERRERDKRGAVVWKQERRNNHWLDCLTYATVGGHVRGVRWVDEPEEPSEPQKWFAQQTRRSRR